MKLAIILILSAVAWGQSAPKGAPGISTRTSKVFYRSTATTQPIVILQHDADFVVYREDGGEMLRLSRVAPGAEAHEALATLIARLAYNDMDLKDWRDVKVTIPKPKKAAKK